MATLRRYTDILSLIDILRNQRLTLLSPANWTDRNDRLSLDVYQRAAGLDGVVALCFTEAEETNHHWQVFAGHAHGVCVIFEKAALLDVLKPVPGLMVGSMEYLARNDLKHAAERGVDRLPFIKRRAFEPEKEFRLIYRQLGPGAGDPHCIQIPLSVIRRITFSPTAPHALIDTLEALLRGFPGVGNIDFHRSSLPENKLWRHDVQKWFGSTATPEPSASAAE